MTILALAREQLIAFVLVNTNGDEVTGLGDTFTVQISENGAAFAAGAGSKAEIGSGWYSYTLTVDETDTAGTLAVLVTGAGAVQQNLLYQISGAVWTSPAGDNILTATEAANVLRTTDDDPVMLMLLPAIDAYIEQATGRDWAADTTVRQEAKNAARMLLVRWYEDPGGMAAGEVLSAGLRAALTQLEALALELVTDGVPDEPLALLASSPSSGASNVAISITPVLVFNHEMEAGATSAVSLQTSGGSPVSTTNTLDATGTIMRLTPAANLAGATGYTIVVEDAADTYGQALDLEIGFTTA